MTNGAVLTEDERKALDVYYNASPVDEFDEYLKENWQEYVEDIERMTWAFHKMNALLKIHSPESTLYKTVEEFQTLNQIEIS